jgi:RecA-family ATPase
MGANPVTQDQSNGLRLLQQAVAPQNTPQDWRGLLQKGVLSIQEFQQVAIKPREKVLGCWFKQADLGYIYAARGVGKTWLSLQIAVCVAEGRSIHVWEVPKARKVLYVDGEMAMDDSQKRIRQLSRNAGGNLHILHHEQLFQATDQVLNLCSAEIQGTLTDYCSENSVEVLVLDNLSCLFSGVRENDADDWELILPWLLTLRRKGIAVIIVHHAGRNGLMRGTSRREDAANWVINLTESTDLSGDQNGACFTSKFTKNRNSMESDAPPLEWTFTQEHEDKVIVGIRTVSPLEEFMDHVNSGLSRAKDIAEEMGISKGQVSKLAKKAMAAGRIRKEGLDYRPA